MAGYRVHGGGSGGGGGATLVIDDDIGLGDGYLFGSSQDERLRLDDGYLFGSSQDDALGLADGYTLTAVSERNDGFDVDDAGRMTITDLIVGRSGTPDTDQMVDGWADRAATGVNHGNESLLVKGNSTVPGTDSRRGFLYVDLTRLSGFVSGANGASLTYIASTSSASNTTLQIAFAAVTPQPFTESTLTWANQPTPAFTSLNNRQIATGAAAAYTSALTQAQLDTCLGKWLLIRFQTADAAVPPTITILSRDNATAANRPKFTAALEIS